MTNASTRLIRFNELKSRVGLSKTTIYDRMSKGTFPRPVVLGTTVAWVEAEIDAWIAARIAERDQGGASQSVRT